MYRILKIPFARDKVDYNSTQRPGLLALRQVFHDEDILMWAISWDDMMTRYCEEFPLACILAGFIDCFLMSDRG